MIKAADGGTRFAWTMRSEGTYAIDPKMHSWKIVVMAPGVASQLEKPWRWVAESYEATLPNRLHGSAMTRADARREALTAVAKHTEGT